MTTRHERVTALFEKRASSHEEPRTSTRQRLKDLLPIAGGTALGAATGYGLSALAGKTRFGKVFRGLSPQQRLALLLPTMALIGGAIPAVNAARDADAARAAKKERDA